MNRIRERQIRLNDAQLAERSSSAPAPCLEVIRTAAAVRPRTSRCSGAAIQTEFHGNQRAVVQSLADKGALAAGLDVDRATDILWALNHPRASTPCSPASAAGASEHVRTLARRASSVRNCWRLDT